MESQKTSKRRLTAHYSSVLLFNKAAEESLRGLEFATCNPYTDEIEGIPSKSEPTNVAQDQVNTNCVPTVSDCMSCNSCQAEFADREEQLQHYKCDWHRYNLHLRLRGLPGISEEEFEKIAGDVSSISGSDEESESESDIFKVDIQGTPEIESSPNETASIPSERKFHKVFFKNEKGDLISLYRCLLHHKKKPITDPTKLCEAACQAIQKPKWIVLMVSSGHFAGAIFNGEEIVEHKTFHRYTVRAKRGTAQSSRDGHGNAPKSAGSSLRRYNEAALIQEVQELMGSWLNHINACELVFVHIPIANRAMFYSGKNPVFRKDDNRIRIIPFPTRRPTFSEVKRVHQMLASIECYGQEADVRDFIPMSPPRMYNKDSGQLELCQRSLSPKLRKKIAKDVHKVENKQPDDSGDVAELDASTATESPEEDVDLIEVMESINVADDLKEFDSSMNKKKRKKKGKKTQDKCESSYDNQMMDENERQIRNNLFTACKLGSTENLQKCLEEIAHLLLCSDEPKTNTGLDEASATNNVEGEKKENSESQDNESTSISSVVSKILNMPMSDNGNTFLHLACMEGHCDIIGILLKNGADPAIKNEGGKLPYNLGNADVRNTFRRFMAQFPDKYDYTKAQVPAPLTTEMEEQKRQKLAKKRAEKKKAAQERNKTQKAAEKIIQEEEQEKSRFLNLSDREKRALAAEKRILQQHMEQGASIPVLSRCYQCGTDITGKVPFEYSDFKFCTTQCLRDHRGKAKR